MATMKKRSAKAAPKKTMMKRPSTKKVPQQPAPQQAPPVPVQQAPQPPMGTPAPGTNGPMMKKGGVIKKKAKAGFDLNKDGKTTFKDVLIGRGVLSKNAKSGGKMKKAQGGISLGKALPPPGAYKSGGKMKKAQNYGNLKIKNPTAKDSLDYKTGYDNVKSGKKTWFPNRATSEGVNEALGKTKTKAKSGGKMTKCKYGCN
jgi:hypothetical protein